MHEKDIETSKEVMMQYILGIRGDECKRKLRALDCGSGIGRVAKHLLLPLFDEVDLVEPSHV